MQSTFENLKVFVVYGNSRHEFHSLNRVVENIYGAESIVIQCGYSRPNVSKNCQSKIFEFCESNEFNEYIREANVVISHSGVGVITECLGLNKMAYVIARDPKKGEHVNDHQISFTDYYKCDGIFNVINNIEELELGVMNNLHMKNPSRKCISDLLPVRNDISKYINRILKL